MNKLLTYSGISIASIVVIVMFATASTPLQLGAAIIIYPILVLVIFKLVVADGVKTDQRTSGIILAPVKTLNEPLVSTSSSTATSTQPVMPDLRNGVELVDIDKRAFLKLVGGVGLSFFIFSLFNKRIGNLLLDGGDTSPTNSLFEGKPMFPNNDYSNGYKITEIISDGEYTYYGFVNNEGKWLVMREETSSGSFRYAKGDSNFTFNWENKTSLQYRYYHETFKD